MTTPIDIFAETNPAFCAYAIHSFASAYEEANSDLASVLLSYVVLPLALSAEFVPTFERTNKATGLLTWIDRSPEITIGLHSRINSTLRITKDAISFGCLCGIITLGSDAKLRANPIRKNNKIKKINLSTSNEAHLSIKRAERLGIWFGNINSTKAVFSILGLSL